MRLLLVNSASPELWGGGEKWFIEAATWFQQHNHEVTLVARPDSLLAKRAQERGLSLLTSRFGGDYDPIAIWKAHSRIRQSRAEIVLTNFNKEAWHFGIASKFTRTPVVARHGFTLWSDKLHHRLVASGLLRRVIVNSASIRDHYQAIGFDVNNIDIIPNGVAFRKQQNGELRKQLGISHDELLLVAAGRLEEQKRFDRLLNSVAALSKHMKFKLALFGQGPHEQQLRSLVNELSLSQVVSFMGFRENFAEVVGDSDLFLLTSDSEGSPNVVLEAMAAGVPVLGFGVGTMPQLLAGELSTFLVEPENETQFYEKLAHVCSDIPALRAQRSRFRNRVNSEFSFDVSMKRYEHVLTVIHTRA